MIIVTMIVEIPIRYSEYKKLYEQWIQLNNIDYYVTLHYNPKLLFLLFHLIQTKGCFIVSNKEYNIMKS